MTRLLAARERLSKEPVLDVCSNVSASPLTAPHPAAITCVAADLARRLEGRRAAADRPGPALALAGSVPGARPLACGSSGSSRHDPVQYALPYDLCHGVARSMCRPRHF